MLVDAPIPDLQIGHELIVPLVMVVAVLAAVLAVRSIRTRALRPKSGLEAMTGEVGEVIRGIEEHTAGTVFVHGEYWTAVADRSLPLGAKVLIVRVEGSQLRVAPAHPSMEGELR